MTDAQAHDFATAPFGVHGMPQDLLPHADLRARLLRPSVGANEEEASALIDALPSEVIRSESDGLLANRVREFRKEGSVYDPAEHSVNDVLAYVGDDLEKARDVLAAEHSDDGKARKTLLAKLEDLVAADQTTTPPVVATPGDADTAGDAADGPHV